MSYKLIKEDKFNYIEVGEGQPIVVLHGLMGTLSNFSGILDYFPTKGYKILVPELPIYDLPLIKTNVKNLAKYLNEFIKHKQLENVILLGNSLGGHVALYYAKLYQENVKALVLTGSSGLYENSMGDTYPRRGDYDFIKEKVQDVFFKPETATKEIVDEVFSTVNDRNKVIKTLAIAKSAIRHNMAKDLPNINVPTCLIWGKNDTVTPPEVADEFHDLLSNSDLYWVDNCGHAAMMEVPEEFNEILIKWFSEKNL
ncbi:alpha/beta fold hydrolase [Aureivirga sp. CE67]|uniref:alpha/beta fold hydrolase n=1 Tax=Aureivirga sp. CE67 TaxID=1788983 RepID=UPI0018CB0C5A|nr:alpha/beta hydrolase [Aureivirga sp. CE67]